MNQTRSRTRGAQVRIEWKLHKEVNRYLFQIVIVLEGNNAWWRRRECQRWQDMLSRMSLSHYESAPVPSPPGEQHSHDICHSGPSAIQARLVCPISSFLCNTNSPSTPCPCPFVCAQVAFQSQFILLVLRLPFNILHPPCDLPSPGSHLHLLRRFRPFDYLWIPKHTGCTAKCLTYVATSF